MGSPEVDVMPALSMDAENPTILAVLGDWYPPELQIPVFATRVDERLLLEIGVSETMQFTVGRFTARAVALELIKAGEALLHYGSHLPDEAS